MSQRTNLQWAVFIKAYIIKRNYLHNNLNDKFKYVREH